MDSAKLAVSNRRDILFINLFGTDRVNLNRKQKTQKDKGEIKNTTFSPLHS